LTLTQLNNTHAHTNVSVPAIPTPTGREVAHFVAKHFASELTRQGGEFSEGRYEEALASAFHRYVGGKRGAGHVGLGQ
jgi:hypothetical protein